MSISWITIVTCDRRVGQNGTVCFMLTMYSKYWVLDPALVMWRCMAKILVNRVMEL